MVPCHWVLFLPLVNFTSLIKCSWIGMGCVKFLTMTPENSSLILSSTFRHRLIYIKNFFKTDTDTDIDETLHFFVLFAEGFDSSHIGQRAAAYLSPHVMNSSFNPLTDNQFGLRAEN